MIENVSFRAISPNTSCFAARRINLLLTIWCFALWDWERQWETVRDFCLSKSGCTTFHTSKYKWYLLAICNTHHRRPCRAPSLEKLDSMSSCRCLGVWQRRTRRISHPLYPCPLLPGCNASQAAILYYKYILDSEATNIIRILEIYTLYRVTNTCRYKSQ